MTGCSAVAVHELTARGCLVMTRGRGAGAVTLPYSRNVVMRRKACVGEDFGDAPGTSGRSEARADAQGTSAREDVRAGRMVTCGRAERVVCSGGEGRKEGLPTRRTGTVFATRR